jgi:hypothetical protein
MIQTSQKMGAGKLPAIPFIVVEGYEESRSYLSLSNKP